MKREYIPGIETFDFFEGERVATWVPDEDGALLRSARIAARAFDVQPMPFNAGMLADLEWQAQMDQLNCLPYDAVEVALQVEDAKCAATEIAGRALSFDLGLVSVLSTQKRGPLPSHARSPRTPFRVQAERAALVQSAGAFVAGGADARMAKLRMSVGVAARMHGAARKGHRPDEVRMVTLTYRPGAEWEANHVRSYMDHVRKWHKRHGVKCRYVWVAEIQDGKRRTDGGARGAVHYHVALWVPVGTAHMPKSDLQGWWPHGSTRTELAKGAVQYLLHYLKKGNSKNFGEFPDGCRIYSVGGLDHGDRRARRWLGLPGFVQGNSSALDDWRRAPVGTGGGWIDPSGVHWPSEFRRINCGGVYALQRIRTHARSIEAAGPFLWLADRPLAFQRA